MPSSTLIGERGGGNKTIPQKMRKATLKSATESRPDTTFPRRALHLGLSGALLLKEGDELGRRSPAARLNHRWRQYKSRYLVAVVIEDAEQVKRAREYTRVIIVMYHYVRLAWVCASEIVGAHGPHVQWRAWRGASPSSEREREKRWKLNSNKWSTIFH